MNLWANSAVASIRNSRLHMEAYKRVRVRNDTSLSVSTIGNGVNNLTALTLPEAIAADKGSVGAQTAGKEDTIEAWQKAQDGQPGLQAMLADIKDFVAKAISGELSAEDDSRKQLVFDGMVRDLNALLAGTTHAGNLLLTSDDALVAVDYTDLAASDLEDNIDGAAAAVVEAIAATKRAEHVIEAKLLVLAGEIVVLAKRADKIDNHEARLTIVEEARSALTELLSGLTEELLASLQTVQANVEPDRAVALLSGKAGPDGSTGASKMSSAEPAADGADPVGQGEA